MSTTGKYLLVQAEHLMFKKNKLQNFNQITLLKNI